MVVALFELLGGEGRGGKGRRALGGAGRGLGALAHRIGPVCHAASHREGSADPGSGLEKGGRGGGPCHPGASA